MPLLIRRRDEAFARRLLLPEAFAARYFFAFIFATLIAAITLSSIFSSLRFSFSPLSYCH